MADPVTDPYYDNMSKEDLENKLGITPFGGHKAIDPQDLGSGEGLLKFLTQNLPMAAVGGIAGGMTGGVAPMLMGAAAMGLKPPQTAGEAATYGLAEGMPGVYQKAASMAKNLPIKTLIKATLGAGQDAAGQTLQGQTPTIGGMATGAALGGGSAIAEKYLAGKAAPYNLQKAQQKLNSSVSPVDTEAAIQDLYKQTAQQAGAKQANTIVRQKLLAENQAKGVDLLASPTGEIDTKALLEQQAENRKLIAPGQVDLSDEGQKIRKIEEGPIYDLDQRQLRGDIKPEDAKLIRDNYQKDIDKLVEQGTARLAQQVGDAQWSKMLDGVVKNSKDLQGVNTQLSTLQDEVAKNPLENVRFKTLLAGGPNGLNSDTFATNLVKADSETVKSYMDYLSDNGKDDQIKATQKLLITKFFGDAWDPKVKKWANAGQVMAGDNDWNSDKVAAIFGGDREGRLNARTFSQAVQDMQSIADYQPKGSATKSLFATPTGFLMGVMSKSTPAGLLKEAAVVGGAKLMQATIDNPKIAAALHKFAQDPSIPNAMMSTWFARNAQRVPVQPPAPPPPPPQQSQPQGQGQPQGQPPQQTPQGPPPPVPPGTNPNPLGQLPPGQMPPGMPHPPPQQIAQGQ